jgi:hypothetical protein
MGVRHRAVPVAHSPRVVVGRAAASAMQLLCPQVRMVGWVAGPAGAFAVQSRCTCYSRHLLRLVDVASAGAGWAGGCQTPSPPWPLAIAHIKPMDVDTGLGHALRVWSDGEGPLVALLQKPRVLVHSIGAVCGCVRVTEQMYLLQAGNACSGHREL